MLKFKKNIKGFIYDSVDGSIVKIFNEELSIDKIKLIDEILSEDSVLVSDEELLNILFEIDSRTQLLEDVELKNVVNFEK